MRTYDTVGGGTAAKSEPLVEVLGGAGYLATRPNTESEGLDMILKGENINPVMIWKCAKALPGNTLEIG